MAQELSWYHAKVPAAIRARTVTVRASWFVFVGVCVGEFELVRFVFWVALHPKEVDLFVGLSWFEFGLVCELRQVMSPTFTT